MSKITLIAAAALGLAAGAAYADPMPIKASIDTAQETPTVSDSQGKGDLTGTFDPATRKLTWKVTYSGLTGDATQAHFHSPGPVGKAGPVSVPMKGSLASPIEGTETLTEAQAKDLMDGNMYFNIHTAKHPPGEVRGQVTK